MSYNSNERLEREARESLVAADLSAKMKQWRNQSPPPSGGGNGFSPVLILLVLLVLGGAVWLFWPFAETKTPASQPEQPAELPAPTQTPAQQAIEPTQEPIAQKPGSDNKRYLALAQSNYRAPDFAAEIRGEATTGKDALNDARRALAESRFGDALQTLKNVPKEYSSDAAYLRGHALFGQKKFAQAAAVFGPLTGSVRYGEAAQWYEILSLLPGFEQDNVLILNKLKTISGDEGHTFQKEAQALQKGINRKM